MKTLKFLTPATLALTLTLATLLPSRAEVIDFENFNLGGGTFLDVGSPLQFSDVGGTGTNVSIVEGADLRVYDLYKFANIPSVTGQALIDWRFPLSANTIGTTITFDNPVTKFSLRAGDFGSDSDTPLTITAYDKSNNIIGSNSAAWGATSNPPFAQLSVNAPGIRKVVYSSGGQYAGSTFIDDITFTPQPRLFTLCVGVNDGAGVRGDLDAQRIFSILENKPQFASASLGNTTAPLLLTAGETGVQSRIEMTLAGMNIRPEDTVIFYFSGHGGSRITGDETAVTIDGQLRTGDEYLVAGDFRLSDDALVSLVLNNSKLSAARKVFMLDSCRSGGFLGDELTPDAGDLEKLTNFSLFAAASEEGKTPALPFSGRGLYTEFFLAPGLELDSAFESLKSSIASLGQTIQDQFSGITLFEKGEENLPGATGLYTFSGFSAASPDFDSSQSLTGSVPEPSVFLLACFGFVPLFTSRRRYNRNAS